MSCKHLRCKLESTRSVEKTTTFGISIASSVVIRQPLDIKKGPIEPSLPTNHHPMRS
jgi:hypothetical protein